MKRVASFAALALSCAGWEISLAQNLDLPKDYEGRIVSVSDGDTITFQSSEGEKLKVRFQGIDAPEVAHNPYPGNPGNVAQPYGLDAKRFVSGIVSRDSRATVHAEETDKYGRSVGTIYLSGGANLNEAVVEAGLAWWYAKYTPDNARLARSEAEARYRRSGLWQQEDPLAPWIFRHPEQKADWDQNKCVLQTQDCAAGGALSTCTVSVPSAATPRGEDVVFNSAGPNECVAKALLEYQLCRGERMPEISGIECNAPVRISGL